MTPPNHPARRRPRRWIPYAGALLLIGLIAAGLWPRPVPVEIGRVTSGNLRASVNEEGKTRIRQRYVVSAAVPGQLRRIPFKAGAEVRADETVVAVIDPLSPAMLDARSRAQAEARRDTALATLEKSRANYKFAVSELRRYQKLAAEKTISTQELENAEMREASAAKEEAACASALRQAEAELAEFLPAGGATNFSQTPHELKAPVSGRVLHVLEENSRVVAAGTPLLEIGNPTNLEVAVEVLSRDGATITPGTRVEFEQWGGGPPLQGRVRLVEPAAFTKVSALGVEEQRVNVVADIVSPPAEWASLGDNFRVEARIIVWEADKTLKAPAGALFRRGNDWAVFTVKDGRAALRVVKIGRSSGTETQILDGLKEGDEVILYPGSRVHDRQRITPVTI
jgi:HlyD family secretion protein